MTIQNAIEKVCEKEPFFSTLVTKLGIVEDKNCPTMDTDGENIYYSPDFLKKLTDQETCGVVLHETLHCVFRHLWRREERDHILWNVACDFAINTIVNESFPLPKGALLDMKYYGMSAEEIYDSFPKQSQSGEGEGGEQGEGKDKKGSGGGKGKKQQKGKGSGQKSQEWGDHSQWENGNGNGDKDNKDKKDKGKSLIEKLFGKKDNRKKGKKSDSQRQATWEKAFKDQMLNQYGSAPESIKRIIEKGYYMPVLDWSALVSQLLSEDTNDYSFSQPDRRFMEADFFLPALASTDRLKDVIFAFDTSGSISEEQLRAFYLETMNLFSNFSSLQGWVAVCDASLHSFNTIDSQSSFVDFGFVGGGGTDFEPVFDRIKREGIQPKAVFYFTDTEGGFPQEKPNYPVFWLVMSSVGDQSERQVPFGTVIKFMPKYR